MDPRLRIIQGDITTLDVDAVVNAANVHLSPGGGVSGAIHAAGGPDLTAEAESLGGCPVGEARITGGHLLRAAHVIHTVGPVWQGGERGEEALLRSAYRESLKLAVANGLSSVAFPLLSAGIFGYPLDEAIRVALTEIDAFLENDATLTSVTVVAYDRQTCERVREIALELG